MKKRYIALAALGIVGLSIGAGAYVITPAVHEGSAGEVPELGRYGEYKVGTKEMPFTLRDRVTFGKLDMATGDTQITDRVLDVRMYYPAQIAGEESPIIYQHTMNAPDMEPVELKFAGRAYSDPAALSDGETYPLVVMSHGFNGWNEQYSNLAEHIASTGYVVASIDHGDTTIEGVSDFIHSFASVLASRSLDQRQVLDQIIARSSADDGGLFALIDAENVGLIGYSMGGYGAVASVGGDYAYDSDTFVTVPNDALVPLRNAADDKTPIDAMIVFAPWGGQPDNRVWNKDALAQITVPVMLVGGSEDDVSNFDEGISWIFDNLTGSDRSMLVYREARHNIVGNAFALPADAPFRAAEFVSEPVWRQDRINGINQHFVSAFLDLHLKGDEEKRAYLDVPVRDSNQSTWDIAFGEQLNGTVASDGESDHWRGFQRRWALGLEMHRKEIGE